MFKAEIPQADIILIDGLCFSNTALDEVVKLILKSQKNNENLRVWSIGKMLAFPFEMINGVGINFQIQKLKH